jgi:hypothetical protein
MNEEDIIEQEILMSTPLTAAMHGRDEDEQFLLSATFLAMDEPERELLSGEKASEAIKAWVSAGILPESHATATMKLVGLIALDSEVQPSEVPSILQKLGLSSEQAEQLANNILNFLQPIMIERAAEEAVESMEELPPLTTVIPSKTEPLTPPATARNVIDLRKIS